MPKPRPPQSDDEYEIREEAVTHRAAARTFPPAELEVEQYEPDRDELDREEPRRAAMEWNLFLGGFGFPWTPIAVARWVLISVWAIVALWLGRLALGLGIGSSIGGGTMSVIGSVLGGVLVGLAQSSSGPSSPRWRPFTA